MPSFATVRSAILTGWSLNPAQPVPVVADYRQYYSITYADYLFLDMYNKAPMKTWSIAGPVTKRQIFKIKGVYATYELANTAMLELKRIMIANGWRVTGDMPILDSGVVFVFSLPCYAFDII